MKLIDFATMAMSRKRVKEARKRHFISHVSPYFLSLQKSIQPVQNVLIFHRKTTFSPLLLGPHLASVF